MGPLATFICKAMVWLAAAAVPLETIPASACNDATPGHVGTNAPHPHSCCAARQHQSCDATGARPRTECVGGCLCRPSGESSTPLPVAKETRSHSVSLWAPVVAGAAPITNESREHVAARFLDFSTPAPYRCAMLCRFVL
jgi:hypothetical protein